MAILWTQGKTQDGYNYLSAARDDGVVVPPIRWKDGDNAGVFANLAQQAKIQEAMERETVARFGRQAEIHALQQQAYAAIARALVAGMTIVPLAEQQP